MTLRRPDPDPLVRRGFFGRVKRPTLARRVTILERKVGTLMGEVEDIKAAQADERQAVADATKRVADDIQKLHDEIAALQGQANPDLSGVLQNAKDIKAAVEGIDPAAPPPATGASADATGTAGSPPSGDKPATGA